MRRERQDHDEEANHDRWLVSYADFITLMFAFFVVMYSISSVSEGKYRVLSDSLMQAFDNPQTDPSPIPNPIELPIEQRLPYEESEEAGKQEPIKDIEKETTTKNEILNKQEQGQEKSGEVGKERDRLNKTLGEIADDIRYEVFPLIEQDLITVNNTDKKIEVEIKSKLLFPSGTARLDTSAIPILSNLAVIFSTFSNPIHVEGFTDDQPINTTTFPSNWELSAARAASVVHLFMRKGIEPSRMSAIGYAEFRPIADNSSEVGRQKNRRVVIIIPTQPDPKDSIDINQDNG